MPVIEIPGGGGYYDSDTGAIVQYEAANPFSPYPEEYGVWNEGSGWTNSPPPLFTGPTPSPVYTATSPTPSPVYGPATPTSPSGGSELMTMAAGGGAIGIIGSILGNPLVRQQLQRALMPLGMGALGGALGSSGIPGFNAAATDPALRIGRRAKAILGMSMGMMPSWEDIIISHNGLPGHRQYMAYQMGNAPLYWAEEYRMAFAPRRRRTVAPRRTYYPRRRYYSRRRY